MMRLRRASTETDCADGAEERQRRQRRGHMVNNSRASHWCDPSVVRYCAQVVGAWSSLPGQMALMVSNTAN